jgi:16S rRNA (uracil1498-N3)-methyltransferase
MPATPAWPPRSAPRLFVPGPLAAGAAIAVSGNQAHYLAKVMRAGEGDAVVLCDDLTGEWAARVASVGKREVVLEPAEKLRERGQVPDVWLCPALLKKDRFDLVLEKATELGVRAIHPVITRRCVADKLNLERARAIVTEAAEQCARTALPELREPVKLDALLADWPEDRTLFFADELGGEPASSAFAAHGGPTALLIGPEGGSDDAERAAIRAHPAARAISLGPRILRGETAAIAAVSLWMAAAGDWGSSRRGPNSAQSRPQS